MLLNGPLYWFFPSLKNYYILQKLNFKPEFNKTEHVKRFDLTFDAEDEQDAEAQAMMEVKQNAGDYFTAYADEEN